MRTTKLILYLAIIFLSTSLSAQTKTKIKSDELPEAVTAELQKKYKKYTIVSVTKAEDSKQVVLYQINVKKKSKEFDLYYSADGVLIRKNKVYTFQDNQLPKRAPVKASDGHNHQH